MQLAQKLLQTEGQLQQSKEEATRLQADLDGALEEAARLKENICLTNQPTSYLVQKLRQEEIGRMAAEKRLVKLEAEIQQYRRQLQEADTDNDNLRQRLAGILAQREEMAAIKGMLSQMQMEEEQQQVYHINH